MPIESFEMGPTATYIRRRALWVGGVGTGDGAVVITVHPQRGMPHSSGYWVQVLDDVVLMVPNGEGKRREYVVTARRCSCDGMRRTNAPRCKHLRFLDLLFAGGHLKPPAGWTIHTQHKG
jgi:hypothetical protein